MMKIGKEREMETGSCQFWRNDCYDAVEFVQKSHHVY